VGRVEKHPDLLVFGKERPGRPTSRVTCEHCGEGINDRREVVRDGQILCRACAHGAYYQPLSLSFPLFVQEDVLTVKYDHFNDY